MKILFSSFALLLFLWFSFRRRIFFLPFHIRSQPSLLFGDQLNEHVQAPLLFPSVPSAFHSYNSALHRYPLPRIIEKRRTTRAFYFLSSLFCSFARICLPSCSGCSPLSQAQLIRFNWKSSAMLSIRALLSRFSRFFPKHIFLYVEVKNRIQKVFFQATKRRTKVPRNSTWNQDFSNINAYKLTNLVTFSEKWCTLFVPFFFWEIVKGDVGASSITLLSILLCSPFSFRLRDEWYLQRTQWNKGPLWRSGTERGAAILTVHKYFPGNATKRRDAGWKQCFHPRYSGKNTGSCRKTWQQANIDYQETMVSPFGWVEAWYTSFLVLANICIR